MGGNVKHCPAPGDPRAFGELLGRVGKLLRMSTNGSLGFSGTQKNARWGSRTGSRPRAWREGEKEGTAHERGVWCRRKRGCVTRPVPVG